MIRTFKRIEDNKIFRFEEGITHEQVLLNLKDETLFIEIREEEKQEEVKQKKGVKKNV